MIGITESLGPDPQNAAVDEEHVARVLIECHLRGLLKVGFGGGPRLQLLVGKAAQQIEPDKIGRCARQALKLPVPPQAAVAVTGKVALRYWAQKWPGLRSSTRSNSLIASPNCSRRYNSSAIRKKSKTSFTVAACAARSAVTAAAVSPRRLR